MECPNSSLMSLLQPKDTICGQARDVAGYESGLPYKNSRPKAWFAFCLEVYRFATEAVVRHYC